MQICIDARLAVRESDGISTYVLGLLQGLLSTDSANSYAVLLNRGLMPEWAIESLASAGVRLHDVPVRAVRLGQQIRIPMAVNRVRPDVYHYPHFDLPLGVCAPSVVTIYDAKYVRHPEFFSSAGQLKRLYVECLARLAVQKAARVITVSHHASEEIQRIYGIPRSKIAVTYLATGAPDTASLRRLMDPASVVRGKYSLHRPYLLFVGQVRPHKNLARLILAFSSFLRASGEDIDLVIAGKPYSGYTEPQVLVERLGLRDRVRFLGFVPEPDVWALYHEALALAYVSLYEGFGLPMLEAMNLGIPVIASQTTCLPEIAGDAALYVDPHSTEEILGALRLVSRDDNLRQELIARGRERVRQFSWRATAESTLSVYEECANRGVRQ